MTEQYQQFNVNRRPIPVAEYGVVGDGVRDDTEAMQYAIDQSVLNGVPVLLQANTTYKLSKGPGLNISGAHIIGGGPSTILDFSGGDTDDFPDGPTSAMWAQGDLGPSQGTIAAATKGDTQVTINTTAFDIEVGDSVMLWDPTDGSFNPSRATYRDGEVNEVIDISGQVITFASPLRSDYANTTRIYNPTWSSSIVENFRIIGISNEAQWACIRFDLCKESSMSKIYASNGEASLISFRRSYDCSGDGLRAINDSDPVGLNYGLGIENSQNIRISNGSMRAARHAITIGGGNQDATIVNRDIIISDCVLLSDGRSGVANADCHGNSESVQYSSCFIQGGMNIGGDKIQVSNCQVYSETVNGIGIQFSEPKGFDFKISDTNFYAAADTVAALILYDQSAPVSPSGDAEMVFDNCLFDMGDFDGNTFLVRVRTGSNELNFTANNCKFKRKSDYAVQGVVKVAGLAPNASLDTVQFINCRFEGCSCYVQDVASKVFISDCSVINGNQRGFSVTSAFAGDPLVDNVSRPLVSVQGCTAVECGFSGFYLDGIGDAYGSIVLRNWTSLRNSQLASGSSADRAAAFIGNSKIASVQEGLFGDDQGVATQIAGLVVSNVDTIWQGNNSHTEKSIPVNTFTNVDAKKSITMAEGKYELILASAPPVTGYYQRGSVCINQAPSSGQPMGWYCSATGDPATWTPMVNNP